MRDIISSSLSPFLMIRKMTKNINFEDRQEHAQHVNLPLSVGGRG